MVEKNFSELSLMKLAKMSNQSLEEVAAKANIGTSTIYAYNRKLKIPSLAKAADLCRALNCTWFELCDALEISTEGIPERRYRKK